jgi:hypothetical protein
MASGCGVKTSTEVPVRTLADGRLSIDPSPMTLADLDSDPPGSPRATLLRLWFSIQWWDEPAILAAYAPSVADTLQPGTMLGAWSLRRGSIIGSRPRNFETTRSRALTVVTFTRESRTSPPAQESATMILERGRWRILHDTMLEAALAAYAQSLGSRRQEAPSAAAVRRGIEASRRFRDLAATRAVRRAR